VSFPSASLPVEVFLIPTAALMTDEKTSPPSGSKPAVPVVFACDEGYAMPLATVMRSLVESNPAHWPLPVYVLTGEFSEASRQRVQTSLPQDSVQLHWLTVDLSKYTHFATLPHISTATYARLLIPDLFPAPITRVLYLDADMLVLDDLARVWEADLGGKPVGAVGDLINDILERGESGWEDVASVARYFNAGVLLMDLVAWRVERISERALEYLAAHPKTRMADQDALNAACDGRWHELPARWNFASHLSGDIGVLPAAERPGIAHFITFRKPWLAQHRSPNARFYDAFRSRTCYARTFPERLHDGWLRFISGVRNVLRRNGLLPAEDGRRQTTPVRRSGTPDGVA
jgi:lipopolysaccharide biosynthesis glycosyltransferase